MRLPDRIAKMLAHKVTIVVHNTDGDYVMPWGLRAGQVIEKTSYSADTKVLILTVSGGSDTK